MNRNPPGGLKTVGILAKRGAKSRVPKLRSGMQNSVSRESVVCRGQGSVHSSFQAADPGHSFIILCVPQGVIPEDLGAWSY